MSAGLHERIKNYDDACAKVLSLREALEGMRASPTATLAEYEAIARELVQAENFRSHCAAVLEKRFETMRHHCSVTP